MSKSNQEEQVRDYTQNKSVYRNQAEPIQKVLRKYLIASTEAEDMHQAMEVENNATKAILALIEQAETAARLDELEKMVREWGYGEYPMDDPRYSLDWEGWAEYRTRALKGVSNE